MVNPSVATDINLRHVAVGSRQHPLAGDEGSTTEVVPRVQGDLVGDGVPGTLVPSHDLTVLSSDWKHQVQHETRFTHIGRA